jgi:hypothetical protein
MSAEMEQEKKGTSEGVVDPAYPYSSDDNGEVDFVFDGENRLHKNLQGRHMQMIAM